MKTVDNSRGKIVMWKNRFLGISLLKKVLIITLLAAIIWFGIKPIFLKGSSQQVQYQTSTVEKGTLINSVTASGTLTSGSSADITTNTSGIVAEVYVKNGDTVSTGQAIAVITPDTNTQQKQAQAYSNYLSAQNNLNSAKSKINSLQSSLFKANQAFVNDKGTTNPDTDDPKYIQERADWLQAEADYNNQENVIRQAEAALTSASLSYSLLSSTITAPMAGIVSNLNITPGISISGSTSSTDDSSAGSESVGSVRLADSMPQATVNLSEIDITKVELGQKVTLTLDAFPDKTFTGKVAAINTSGSTSSGVTTYPVTIVLDSKVEKMYPNMAVSSTIITGIKNNVLLVPLAAVATSADGSSVKVMKNGKPETVSVEVGDTNDTEIEIITGLKVGDIVVSGQTGGATGATTGTSPFSGTGFGGGARAGGSNAVFIQRR